MIIGSKSQRQVIFDGNSLSKGILGSTDIYRFPNICTSSLRAAGKIFASQCYAVSGKPTSELITDFPTKIAPYVRSNDIVVLWEITNDLYVNSYTATQAYNDIVTYAGLVRALNAKFVVVTMVARNYSLDPVGLWAIGQAANALIAADASCYDAIARPDLDTNLDQKSDCSNTTYYLADQLHLTNTGLDLVASYAYPAIQTLL